MTKEERYVFVEELAELLGEKKNFYIADTGGLNADSDTKLRKLCYKRGVKLQMVKNTFIKKALERMEIEDEALHNVLVGTSSILYSKDDNLNAPAKLIKEFRKESDKPILKAAYVEEAVYIGDDQLEALINIKSREELIADVVALLKAPAVNVISALQSGGGKIAGILKTLSEREEA